MAIFLLVALLVDSLMLWGVSRAYKQRRTDWRHYASFVGFTAGFIAVTDTALTLIVAAPHTHSPGTQGFLFITSLVALIAITSTVVAGLCSRGTQRLSLVMCGFVTGLTFLLAAVGHFGD